MENGQFVPERRKQERIEVNFTATYTVNKPLSLVMLVGGREVEALMLNLSEGGMCLVTEYDITEGALLSIKFTLINLSAPGDQRTRSMEIEGEVRYNTLYEKNEHRLGIRFSHVEDEDKKAITSFVKTAGL